MRASQDTPGSLERDVPNACASADSCSSGEANRAANCGGNPRWPATTRRRRHPPPQCQVPGCEAELCTPYCIRRRLCSTHMRSDAVLRKGHSQQQLWRFCFQCGKLEQLELFDGDKRSCRTRLAKRLKLGKPAKGSKQKSVAKRRTCDKTQQDKRQQQQRLQASETESSGCNIGGCHAQFGQQQCPAGVPEQLGSTRGSRDAYHAKALAIGSAGSSSGASWQSGGGGLPTQQVAAAPCTVWHHQPAAAGLLPSRCPSFTSGGSSTCLDQQCSWWGAPELQQMRHAAPPCAMMLPQHGPPAPLRPPPLGLSMQQPPLLAAPQVHTPLEQPQPGGKCMLCVSPTPSVASTLTPAIDGLQHVQRPHSCSAPCRCCAPLAAPFMTATHGCSPAAPGSVPGVLKLLEQESMQLMAEYTDALNDALACLGPVCAL